MKKFLITLTAVLAMTIASAHAVTPIDDPTQPDIVNYYGAVLLEAYANDTDFGSFYSLYDFDKDGITELIIDNNQPHVTRQADVYKFNGELIHMGSFSLGYGELCGNDDMNGILTYNAYRMNQWIRLAEYVNSEFSIMNFTDPEPIDGVDAKEPHEIVKGTFRLQSSAVEFDDYLKETFRQISVKLNGNNITFDQPPIMRSDRVLVPIRAIFEAMGYTVTWDQETKTATAVNGDNIITVQVDNEEIHYKVNGFSDIYICDVAPQIISDRTLVPVRAISESAGCDVSWNQEDLTVYIKNTVQK